MVNQRSALGLKLLAIFFAFRRVRVRAHHRFFETPMTRLRQGFHLR
jgi:hypothetical protein